MFVPTAVDLFCGCGGLTVGLKRAGFCVIGALDSDPLAIESFRLNHPEAKLWERDIGDVSASRMMRELGLRPGKLDLLAGCPPCQGFSSLRTLNGSRGVKDRNKDLVFEFLRFVRVLIPKTVMLENVPGLAADWRMKALSEDLLSLGYTYEHRILDAADYGVPQRRRRVILLAGRSGSIPFADPLPTRPTVRDAIGHLPRPGRSGDPLHDHGETRASEIVELIKRIPKNGGGRLDMGDDVQLACHRRCDGFFDVYGRMAWDNVAPTITSGCVNPSKGRFLHPRQNRSITLREAALLQTFPRNYRLSLRRGKFEAARMIGNALPPEFVRRHARSVRIYLARVNL
jgi:DNA (cytosine-5)-methyltransferase 1